MTSTLTKKFRYIWPPRPSPLLQRRRGNSRRRDVTKLRCRCTRSEISSLRPHDLVEPGDACGRRVFELEGAVAIGDARAAGDFAPGIAHRRRGEEAIHDARKADGIDLVMAAGQGLDRLDGG